MFEKIDTAVSGALKFFVFVCFVLLLVLVSAQVYVRMFTTSSLTWSEELSTFVMIWMVLLASVLVYRNKGHIWVENLTSSLTGPAKSVVLSISSFACLLFMVLIIFGAFRLLPTVHSQLSPACKIRMSYIYFALPFSFFLTCIYVVRDIYEELRSL